MVFFFFLFSFFFYFFFFQAEDGIRDLVRSRGLGDVYKRQVERMEADWGRDSLVWLQWGHGGEAVESLAARLAPVSYTHLTLPTSDLV